jgi:tetratricopeptide (TPR) repeat protein
MKLITAVALILLTLPTLAQDSVVEVNAEPTSLYQKANESLSAGDTRNAILIFDQVVTFYEEKGRENELPESYLGMALSFALNGNYSESIRYHKKALRAHHKYRCDESALEIELNLGLAYQLAGKERKAKKYLKSEFHG